MSTSVVVAGVGMIPFTKPGRSAPYDAMGGQAARLALSDAGILYELVQQAYVGYVYGDSTCGQRALYEVGMTGIPVVNVNNNCATGSTALFLARQAVASGAVECALALGFEQMVPGALSNVYSDRPSPLGRFTDLAQELHPCPDAMMAPHLFGSAAAEYAGRHGTQPATFAMVAVKARRHAEHNEMAIFRDRVTLEQVLQSPTLYGPMTRLQCCPPTCGAAAAVLVTESFARRHGLAREVCILGQALVTDGPSTFDEQSMCNAVGYDMARKAAAEVYEQAAVRPQDIDVCELHDCFTVNELLSYEALGFAPEGESERFIVEGGNTYGGSVVTNPSGGLLSKGHPLGATGLAQCKELVDQLRGRCGRRQVDKPRLALQHNLGLGGACVVTCYGQLRNGA
jgi:sterol carrier protein 2